MNILEMLESIEWCGDDCGEACPSCGYYVKHGHHPDCQLKAAIDDLKSGRLQVVACDVVPEYIYVIKSKYIEKPLVFDDRDKAYAWYEGREDSCSIGEFRKVKENGNE